LKLIKFLKKIITYILNGNMILNEKDIEIVKNLYKKIFIGNVEESKEFINFVNGNPHPLRILIDEHLGQISDEMMSCLDIVEYNKLLKTRDLLKELERFIMEHIENNN